MHWKKEENSSSVLYAYAFGLKRYLSMELTLKNIAKSQAKRQQSNKPTAK